MSRAAERVAATLVDHRRRDACARDFPALAAARARQAARVPRQRGLGAAAARRDRRRGAYYAALNHANVHRGVHDAQRRTRPPLFEGAREKVRRFVNAALDEEIVFMRGTTEAINLVAQRSAGHASAPATRS